MHGKHSTAGPALAQQEQRLLLLSLLHQLDYLQGMPLATTPRHTHCQTMFTEGSTLLLNLIRLQGMFSPPDPTPGSAFNQGIQAREALLKDLAQLVRQREERREAAGIKGNSQQGATYKNVLDYTLEDMRSWVSLGTGLRGAGHWMGL